MDSKSFIDFSVLQQSEYKFRSLFESMFEGFFLYEVIYDQNQQPYDYRCIEMNDAAVKLLGLSKEELIGNTLRNILPGISQKWQDYYSRAASGENLELEEYSPILKKYFKSVMYSPFPGYIATLSFDITQRKQTEEALRQSEERLRYSLEAADEGYWDCNVKTNKLYFSPRYYTMLGYEPFEFESSYESWINLMHPDQRDWLPEKAVNTAILQDNLSIEFQLRNKSGEYRWILSRWKVFGRDKNGIPIRIIGTHSDITERKQIEEALRLSEERLRYALEAADEGYWDWELKSSRIFLSPRYYTMLGYEPDEFELTLDKWFNMLHPDSQELISRKLADPKSIPDNFSFEFQMSSKSGEFRWILSHWKIFNRDEDGCPLRILGTNSDITDQKRIQETLYLNEHRMSLILDAVPVAFFDVDVLNGFNIKWISSSVEKLTGFPPEKFIDDQEFWKSRVHKDDQPNLTELLKTPKDLFQIEHRLKCADNKFKWFLYRVFFIRTEQGKPKKIIGLMHDISKSKSYEKKLKSSEKQALELARHLVKVREEERKNLSREVHDELGQSLTVLKLMANSIKKDILKAKPVNPAELDEMAALISSTIKSVQRITTELRPDILDTVGLVAAIEWQIEAFSRHNKVECWSDLKNICSCDFDSSISTVIFRTVQEALTNVSRHAGATRVDISLRKEGKNVTLTIEDNGIGISSKKLKDMNSFGLKGMQERAVFAGGKVSITGRKEKGTKVKLKIPLERAFTKYKPKTS